jgi:biotin carboxyl carrier protein
VGRKVWIALALLLGLAACRDDGQEAAPVRPVLSVAAMVRTTDTLGPFAGTIEPRYKADLGFRIFGRMVARFVDVGATVTKDQELAALDPAVQTLAVRSAEATVANAQAQFVNAEAEEGRQRDLALRNITPQAQFELIQRNRETAEANLTRARASLRKAKDLLSFTQLKADFDGVVTGRYAEPGQVVNAGQKIVTVARPEIREAVIAVPRRAGRCPVAPQRLHDDGRSRSCRLDEGRFRAQHRSDGRSDDPHAQSLSHPQRSAGRLPTGHHDRRHAHPAGVAPHRLAGNRAARKGRQIVRLAGRPGQEHGGAASSDRPLARRRHHDRHSRHRRGRSLGRPARRHRRRP